MSSTVDVHYEDGSGRAYAFKTQLTGLTEGDAVLVKDRHGIHVAAVVQQPSKTPEKASAWAFQKVDFEALRRAERHDRVLSELKAKVDENQTLQLAYMLADSNPEIMALIKELEA
ncbi:hypothetical protein SEA_KINGBOB_34 [Arthrobacter phage KingBob]|uniref:Uncharacterized protein n=1 Tax=Arthrobacter phage Sergei TaxID=2250416 RepID=A0A345KPX2_9CAUD|nr:hypothetical protein KDJ06_gp34 [Arthrobacter phage Sergei]ASZ74348.1 hypothetical protein TEMPER16_34 [Arthrobacter phage Temper16]AXH43961.1 hypothetical protein SEA_DAIBOJU_34 [Arthrobacter phage Daiboju]AXH44023.1 hypothetical protein SEA_HERB_34 [Arthrobacter phage Herb]AXH44267.1 hypothetical protein SEA_KINGBOB_34 [Arthrobacter phage KingBob]QGJ97174.1 hypothetical protein SEA_MARIA1952_33 [Arthrobacter phage Maria1952]